jgi:hypothetical protein
VEYHLAGIKAQRGVPCVISDETLNTGTLKRFSGGRGNAKNYYVVDTTGDDWTDAWIAYGRGKNMYLDDQDRRMAQEWASKWHRTAIATTHYLIHLEKPVGKAAMERGLVLKKTTADEDTRVISIEVL